jgi:hypothetical protein
VLNDNRIKEYLLFLFKITNINDFDKLLNPSDNTPVYYVPELNNRGTQGGGGDDGNRKIMTGPRGGKYYIINNKKNYVSKSNKRKVLRKNN